MLRPDECPRVSCLLLYLSFFTPFYLCFHLCSLITWYCTMHQGTVSYTISKLQNKSRHYSPKYLSLILMLSNQFLRQFVHELCREMDHFKANGKNLVNLQCNIAVLSYLLLIIMYSYCRSRATKWLYFILQKIPPL